MADKSATTQATTDTRKGWSSLEVWDKYEDIAMHFNDLLMRLRTQALAAVAAISVVAGMVVKEGATEKRNWELLAVVLSCLSAFWVAVWVLDFLYYNRLLIGAVDAIVNIERHSDECDSVETIDISRRIEAAVMGESLIFKERRQTRLITLMCGVWIFYGIVLVTLLAGVAYSCYRCGHLS